METLTDATHLRKAGYLADYSATDDGHLECRTSGARQHPETMTVHETVRFEGDSQSPRPGRATLW